LRSGRFFAVPASNKLVATEAGLSGKWYLQPSGDKYVAAARIQTGKFFAQSPLDELYILGMERDNPYGFWLRGHVGARYGKKGSTPMGDQIATLQTDLSRRIFTMPFVRFFAGPFFDVGSIGSKLKFENSGWHYDTGVQGRVTTLGGIEVMLIYGRDLRAGRGVFYTAIER
jgi:hypothetical protein